MPIYEFKCSKCEEFFELLVMKNDDDKEVKCPKCDSMEFERIMSSTNFSMGSSNTGSSAKSGVNVKERTCTSGSCSTYTIPGSDD